MSNGLVLCGDHPNYHVFNPITRRLFSLPPACIDIESTNRNNDFVDYQAAYPGFFSSEFDNDFLVVMPTVDDYIRFQGKNFVQEEMYSSKTGIWKEFKPVAAAGCFHVHTSLLFISINGATFVWSALRVRFMAYDPRWVDNQVLLIMFPELNFTDRPPILCQSSDGFLQCAVDSLDFPGFQVFTLAKKLDSYGREALIFTEEWIPTYNVRLDVLDAVWDDPFRHAMHTT